MDSQNRGESEIRRRQESLARRMSEALDQMKPHGAGKCPDAGVIAAYAEQALGLAESAQWEDHFAMCARCRKILLVLAASADTPLAEKEVAQLGELVSAVRAPVEITGKSAGRARPRLVDWSTRWLAPALGVAAVLVVWFVMRPPWRAMDRGASETLVAQAPKNEPSPNAEIPASDQFSRAAPTKKLKTDSAIVSEVLKDQSVSKAESAKPTAEVLAKNSSDEAGNVGGLVPNAGVAQSASGDAQKEHDELNGTAAGTPVPAPPKIALPSPKALAQSQARGQPRSTPEAAGSTTQSSMVAGAAPQDETAADSAANAPTRDKKSLSLHAEGAPLVLSGRNYVVMLKSPSGRVLWDAGRGGFIQRSTDGGQTWDSQTSPFTEDWEAGEAISDRICWLVGDRGAIARSMDANHWQKILPPAAAADSNGAFPDWIAIAAKNARDAVIEARDERRFATQDGGKTWHLQ